jgi:hypothetical protein
MNAHTPRCVGYAGNKMFLGCEEEMEAVGMRRGR